MYYLLLNSLFNNKIPKINDKTSAIIELHNIVTTLWLNVAIIIIAGTKNITSLAKASKVDLKLDPIDCNKIDNDLVIQVKIIPPKKILKQYLEYSRYSKELLFPKILIINVGYNSNIINAMQNIFNCFFNSLYIFSSHIIANNRHATQRYSYNY